MKNKIIVASFAILILIFFVLPVGAEELPMQPVEPISSGVNCFDYYKFQSVQVSLGTEKDDFQAGEKLTLKGDLLNENTYPVVDGNVFVRISEKNPNYQAEGQFIVDEFIALSDVILDANERKPIEFSWNIPSSIKAGEYRADFFFSVGKKFNLGGLPFTNEIVVGMAEFNVKSENSGAIVFDKAKTTVNGNKYNHIGAWPMIDANAKVDIVQSIQNTNKDSKKIKIQYDLYFWDSLNEKDKINSKTEEISIDAGKSVDLKYSIDSMKDSVYMLKITAVSGEEKSIVNIRLTSDQKHPRLNYPAINQFPLKKGDSFVLFSCFHNTSNENAKGKMILSLFDKAGKQVDQMQYDGEITGDMMADKKDITAKENYDYLKLKAELKDENGKTIETYESIYDCSKINSAKCQEMIASGAVQPVKEGTNGFYEILKTIVLIVFILIPLGVIVYFIYSVFKK